MVLSFFSFLSVASTIVPVVPTTEPATLVTEPATLVTYATHCGKASHYGVGDGYHGRTTANGERFNAYGMTAAHPSLPMGSKLLVKNVDNGKSVVVRVNDRGPYTGGRILDLSYGSFASIAPPGQGIANICMLRQ